MNWTGRVSYTHQHTTPNVPRSGTSKDSCRDVTRPHPSFSFCAAAVPCRARGELAVRIIVSLPLARREQGVVRRLPDRGGGDGVVHVHVVLGGLGAVLALALVVVLLRPLGAVPIPLRLVLERRDVALPAAVLTVLDDEGVVLGLVAVCAATTTCVVRVNRVVLGGGGGGGGANSSEASGCCKGSSMPTPGSGTGGPAPGAAAAAAAAGGAAGAATWRAAAAVGGPPPPAPPAAGAAITTAGDTQRRPRSARHPVGGGQMGVSLPLERPGGRARARSKAGGLAEAARTGGTPGRGCGARTTFFSRLIPE